MQCIRELNLRAGTAAKICSRQIFPAINSRIIIMVKSAKPKAQKPDCLQVQREMTITHADFFRLLPKALSSYRFKISDQSIQVTMKTGVVNIQLDQEIIRKIGALELPITHMTFYFENTTKKATRNFFEKFDMAYLKGGG